MNRTILTLAAAIALLAAGGCRATPSDAPASDEGQPAAAVVVPPADGATNAEAPAAQATADEATTNSNPTPSGVSTFDDGTLALDEVTAITQVVSHTFRTTMRAPDPAWQDVTVRELSTDQLSALRGQPDAPVDDARVARGNLWVVGFRTTLPVTLADLPPDNPFDLAPDGPIDAPQADENGLTSVYYVLGTSQELGGPKQYTLLSRGILPTNASWTLEDLAATGTAP